MDIIAGLMPPTAASPCLALKGTEGGFGEVLAQVAVQAAATGAPGGTVAPSLLRATAPGDTAPATDEVAAAAPYGPPKPPAAEIAAAPAQATGTGTGNPPAAPGAEDPPAPHAETPATSLARLDEEPDAPESPQGDATALVAMPAPAAQQAPPAAAALPAAAQNPALAARGSAVAPMRPEAHPATSAETDAQEARPASRPAALPQAMPEHARGAVPVRKGLIAAREAGLDAPAKASAGAAIAADGQASAIPPNAVEGIAFDAARPAPRPISAERPEGHAAPTSEAPPPGAIEAPRPTPGRLAAEAAPPPPRSPPAGPALRQITPAVVALAVGGGARLTVTLDPEELGRVEISVERSGETTQVRILAERAETMILLQRDHRELDRALTQAGVSQEGRALSFGLSAGDGGAGQQQQGRQGGAPGRSAWNLHSPDSPAAEAPPRRIAVSLLDLAI